MSGYLINFVIYTTAMIGIIFSALFVFKKLSNGCFSKKSSMLNIEDSMNLSPRKTLYVIKAENERFLIAADIDKTALIAKLDSKSDLKSELKLEKITNPIREDKSSRLSSFDGIDSMSEFSSLVDFDKFKQSAMGTPKKGPMMKELAKKLSAI